MKNLTEYILEFKQRKTKTFDYWKIEKAIKECKPTFLGKNVCIDILWAPQIYFIYDKGWCAGKPNDDPNWSNGKKHNGIKLGETAVLFLDFFAEKKLFKKDIFKGYISWILPDKINDDDTNCDELESYLNKMSNYEVPAQGSWPAQKKIEVESYEELEKYLKEIEKIINTHNTKCDANEPTYLYFDKAEASFNAKYKKTQYELLSCEEEIVKLNKQLEDIKKAASASDTDLTALIDATEEKIQYFKKKKDNIK